MVVYSGFGLALASFPVAGEDHIGTAVGLQFGAHLAAEAHAVVAVGLETPAVVVPLMRVRFHEEVESVEVRRDERLEAVGHGIEKDAAPGFGDDRLGIHKDQALPLNRDGVFGGT